MQDALIAVVERFAKRTTIGGQPALVTDGDPALVAAFAALGWDDPHVPPPPPPPAEPEPAPTDDPADD